MPVHGLRLCPDCARLAPRPDPPLCPACGVPRGGGAGPCPGCRHAPPAFDRARALFAYGGIVPDLVLRLKYGRAFDLAAPLGRATAAVAAAEGLGAPEVVVPVPLAPGRLRARGYNQAALLAAAVARALGRPLAAGALARVRDPGPQGHRGRAERAAAVRGAFAAARTRDVAGRRVLLVDDVLTTGATAGECARVLREAGATAVDVAVVARVDDA